MRIKGKQEKTRRQAERNSNAADKKRLKGRQEKTIRPAR
jgi:hypothetical protein